MVLTVARPKKAESADEPKGTKHIRVNADLADMLSDILLVEPRQTSARIVDPWLRPSLVAKWEAIRDRAAKIRRQQAGEAG